MNVIVKKHYPVEKLPADLRLEVGDADTVTLTLTVTPDENPRPKIKLSELIGSINNVHGDEDEVIRYLREGREDNR